MRRRLPVAASLVVVLASLFVLSPAFAQQLCLLAWFEKHKRGATKTTAPDME